MKIREIIIPIMVTIANLPSFFPSFLPSFSVPLKVEKIPK